MKSLIVQTKSDGSQRRCDAHCYNATCLKCKCICGGANHGVGLSQACDNVETYIRATFKDQTDIETYLDHRLAGVGGLEMFDRIFPGRIPQYQPVSPGIKNPMKLFFFLGGITAGGLAWNFINRKFHIISRRHAPRRRKSKKR